MKPGKETFLFLTCSTMEITWRYAWACFLTLAISHSLFPLPEALIAFAMAALFTHLSMQKNWRVYQSAIVHAGGFIFIAFLITYRVYYENAPFFNTAWIVDLLRQPKEPQQWFTMLLLFFCQLLFWIGGRRLIKRPRNHLSVCLQFDKGLGAFLLLLLIILLVQAKSGIALEYPAAGFMVAIFFIFSLLSIGLSRNQSGGQKSFLTGYHGIGVILIFTTIVVLCSAVMVLLFFTHLTHMADSAQSVLKKTAEPMVPVLVKIIRFIFGGPKFQGGTGTAITGSSDANAIQTVANGGWGHFFEQAIGWGLIGVMGLAVIAVLVVLSKYVVGWLLKRNAADGNQNQTSAWLLKFLSALATIPLNAWHGLFCLLKDVDSAVPVYSGLLGWGRRSGLPPVPSETPIAYGNRLSHNFPELKAEIEVIIEMFNREVYGKIVIDQQQLSQILSAQRKMRSPRYWLSRLRGWFVHHPHSSEIRPAEQ